MREWFCANHMALNPLDSHHMILGVSHVQMQQTRRIQNPVKHLS